MKRAPILLLILFSASCKHAPVAVPSLPVTTAATAETAARGEYIVRSVAVCGHCHSADPKNADGVLSGGREFHDWRIGTARGSNLTPDPDTGLGAWSEAEIVRALRNGQSRDGRLLAPVMPYEWFSGMSDEDAFAVARYLKSLAPVRNPVRQSPNLIFKIGRATLLAPKPARSSTSPAAGPSAAYGGYLAQHIGLCGDCHTPRKGLLSKPDRSRLFAGTSTPPKGFPANPSNLTPDAATGIGRWTEEDFLRTMRTGVNPSGVQLHPFMPWHELRRMSDDDLHAIYRYLRSIPPIRNEVKRRASGPS
jgi:mono/diheme cytochrome c family protein